MERICAGSKKLQMRIMMNVIYERCYGIDVHKKMIMTCVFVKGKKVIRQFGTMTDELMKFTSVFLPGTPFIFCALTTIA